jgi:phosphate:Na+ symporter
MPDTAPDITIPALVAVGLLLFLFGMKQLESGIRVLGYDTFKRWLSRSTSSPAGSAATGVVSTALLQSSSLVSLLVLAFASAGALPLYNAIGIILGANLGTTVTGWMVATIGFKLSLQTFALPLMAVGGLMQLAPERFPRLRGPGVALFGLGLIIFGLDLMKGAVADLPQQWDLQVLKGHGLWLYFLAGIGIAALIQSSSATMMITLTALHAGLLDLSAAAAVVIGADLGTTSTTALGSIGGHYIKRQLALAHILFNVIIDLASFFFLLPILPILIAWLALEDPLYSLVAFHSLFNLIGLLVFLPFLKPFAQWVGGRFRVEEPSDLSLEGLPLAVPDAELLATGRVLSNMRLNAVVLSLHAFHLRPEQLQLSGELHQALEECFELHEGMDKRYNRIKRAESELLSFSFDLQEQPLSTEQVSLLERQTREARALVYSSKTINDIRGNLVTLRHHSHTDILDWYKGHRNFVKTLYKRYLGLADEEAPVPTIREILAELMNDNENHYRESNDTVNSMASSDSVTGIELSTMLNVNREIHHSLKNLLLLLDN